eukprot:g7697.t1
MEGASFSAGSLGPRLAGRLTPELILRSPQYMNCIQNYELDLRGLTHPSLLHPCDFLGNKLGVIENLGATEDQFDSIDFSDNAIVFLEGFPRLPRLKVLLLNNNRISRIGTDLEDCIPNLQMLILTNNKIENLKALDPLKVLHKIKHLCLLGNPVTKAENYRQYVVQLLPNLKVLDFTKVQTKVKFQIQFSIGSVVQERTGLIDDQGHTFDPDKDVEMLDIERQDDSKRSHKKQKKGPSVEQITAIKAAIQNAETLEEVKQLEAALKSGVMPTHLQQQDPSSEQQTMDTDRHEKEQNE